MTIPRSETSSPPPPGLHALAAAALFRTDSGYTEEQILAGLDVTLDEAQRACALLGHMTEESEHEVITEEGLDVVVDIFCSACGGQLDRPADASQGAAREDSAWQSPF